MTEKILLLIEAFHREQAQDQHLHLEATKKQAYQAQVHLRTLVLFI